MKILVTNTKICVAQNLKKLKQDKKANNLQISDFRKALISCLCFAELTKSIFRILPVKYSNIKNVCLKTYQVNSELL
jgi:hypothetical protein